MQYVCESLEPRRLFSTNVLSSHYNTSNTGLDAVETTLTPANVGSASFGELFSLPVDGAVHAQPLYVSNLAIPGQGTHNVVFVATEYDSVYAFDAQTGAQLWKTSLLGPGETPGNITTTAIDTVIAGPWSGITGTPVIDSSTNTMYVVSKSQSVVNGVSTTYARIHALNIMTGAEKFGGPTTITATIAGTSEGGTTISFNPFTQLQRGALALDNGVVYVDFCSGNGVSPWHGWVMGYNASTLTQVAVFCDTPNGPAEPSTTQSAAISSNYEISNIYGGGIWMSGAAPIIDSSGNLYYATGAGNFDPTLDANGFPANGDYGDSYVKLTPNNTTSADPNLDGWGLSVTDYFTPAAQETFNSQDLDLGSGGLLMLANQPGPVPNELVGSDKSGNIYVINMANMGKYDPSGDHAVQELNGILEDPSAPVVEEDGSYATPALFNNVLYFHGANDVMQAFTLSNGKLQTPPAEGSTVYQFPGATPVISANGTANAIVWETQYSSTADGALNAYSPGNLSTPLFSASLNEAAEKFSPPIVADGQVYVGGANSVDVFGLLPTATGGTFIDAGGPATGKYVADTDFSGGSTYSTTSSINTSADPTGAPQSVYQTERYGNFTYTTPNLTAGNTYSVRLHFAELYWNSAGQRLFNVSINGQQVLTNFDIFATAGGEDKAIVESFNATANASGNISIVFTSVKDNAKVDAIDVVPTTVAAPAPTVTGVSVDSTAWSASFPYAAAGYTIPTGASQLLDLPWTNLNQVIIKFDEAVNVAAGDLTIDGVSNPTYGFSNFSYNSTTFTATWTLSSNIPADKLLLDLSGTGANAVTSATGAVPLDGTWSNGSSTFPSGSGTSGVDFDFDLNVLPGDVQQTGTPINIFDVVAARNAQGGATDTPLDDVNGDGVVNIFDVLAVRNLQTSSLPTGTP